jgi:LacI family transcriptional regulator
VLLWQELRPGTPVVALNATAAGITGVSRVYPDNAVGVGLAMRRLAELGHSRVAFLSAPRGLVADPDRLRQFRRLARELGIRPTVMHAPLTIAEVRKAAGTMLARQDAPTAVITNSDYTALGIYLTARDLSLRVGPDVSVIGHDDLPTSELLDPPLATIRLDGREMGRAVMARLLGGGPLGDYIAPVDLVERASLQAPRPSPRSPRIIVPEVPAARPAATR